jgi:hypothetical protein
MGLGNKHLEIFVKTVAQDHSTNVPTRNVLYVVLSRQIFYKNDEAKLRECPTNLKKREVVFSTLRLSNNAKNKQIQEEEASLRMSTSSASQEIPRIL